MTKPPAIVVEHVSKQFAGTAQSLVDDCSFEVTAGQLIVLLGPSGCGKTTLLKLINRLYEPSAGRILLNGTDVMQLPVTNVRRQIGYVIQQTGLFPHMRVEANIAVVPRLLGWEQPRIDARIDQLLELLDLPNDYRRRYPRQLSGGEQQRVGIAQALAADPEIMLMDEPFGAVDAITRARLQEELLRIHRKLHKTILFVTHDVDEALRLADKIMVMRQGQIVQFDTPLALLTQPADQFVASLVASGDMLRRLGLLQVGAVAGPFDGNRMALADAPRVSVNGDVRAALSLLLGSGADVLVVVGDDEQPVGMLTFDIIQAAIRQSGQPPVGGR